MLSTFTARITVRPTVARRGRALFLGGLLFAGTIALLCWHIGYGWDALTGCVWKHTDGTVVNTRRTSSPTVQFSLGDGAIYSFSEDYILLCGSSRDFCMIRHFNPGQVVPVVYDPLAPKRAFIHDWALFATVGSWLVELVIALLLAWLLAAMLSSKPLVISMSSDRGPDLG